MSFIREAPRVDLVGDVAGGELFFIHGEGLLLHCLKDATVDFEDNAFQLVHAVYVVEKLLLQLRQRGCLFDIVFFEDHADTCMPGSIRWKADDVDSAALKYVIARKILIQHLRRFFAESKTGAHETAVHVFGGLGDEAFKTYLDEKTVRYVFAHPGFEDQDTRKKELLEEIIYQLVAGGYHVALLDNVTFQSSKIFANLIAAYKVEAREDQSVTYANRHPTHGDKTPLLDRIDTPLLRENIAGPEDERITLREAVLVAALRHIYESSPDAMPKNVAVSLLIHAAALREASLAERACIGKAKATVDYKEFLSAAAFLVNDLQQDGSIKNLTWDLHDLIDGNVLAWIDGNLEYWDDTPNAVKARFGLLADLTFGDEVELKAAVSSDFQSRREGLDQKTWETPASSASTSGPVSVLPFSHPVLDAYFEPVQVTTDGTLKSTSAMNRVFKEAATWNSKKAALDPRRIPKPPSFFARRRHQWLMADVVAYAASLTGVTGKALNPEVIVCGPKLATRAKPKTEDKKHTKKVGGRAAALEAAAATAAKKNDKKNATALSNWKSTVERLEKVKTVQEQYLDALDFLKGSSDEAEAAVGAEVRLYLCYKLWLLWESHRGKPSKTDALSIVAMLFDQLQRLSEQPGHTKQVIAAAKAIAGLAGLPVNIPAEAAPPSRPLPFTIDVSPERAMPITTEPKHFQLAHSGPYMSRNFDSSLDPRVPFAPDAWQREVLDAIDDDKSLLVVAPTSAGKTFISFYAMKKTLQANHTDILVYVAPTKALVNQIAAEIAARFSKTYPGSEAGKSVWAIHTRDYRVNSAVGCQVLVTVPHVLQSMLLAPSNADRAAGWARRVRRIIFDEVHCIGQAEDGVVWEQLLLLAPCPIVALSATVGNAGEFRDWLADAQAQKGYELKMVVHESRYSDLRKFIYHPPEGDALPRLLVAPRYLPAPALDEGVYRSSDFRFVHPIAAVLDLNRGSLRDVSLESRDCLTLWEAMTKLQTPEFPVSKALDPKKFLPAIPTKNDVARWEKELKKVLQTWTEDKTSPFEKLRSQMQAGLSLDQKQAPKYPEGAKSSIIPLVYRLYEQGSLPALMFNYSRSDCEERVQELVGHLQAEEARWKEGSKEWKSKIADYEAWQKRMEKDKNGKAKVSKEKMSKAEAARAAAEIESSPWASFNPDAPLPGFTLGDNSATSATELEKLIDGLGKDKVAPWMAEALRRGVGVHHAGLNRRYRQLIEILFRRKYLRVVVATGTLALGVNMPCKTVVFLGDSVFLTALNYRQASGRAGRRGFDLVGNVVFADIPASRALEIMSLRLPDLRGQFPSSTSLVLRIMGLLDGTAGSDYAVNAANALLSQKRAYLGGPEAAVAVKHHLRFSIEYLRRQHLLSEEGTPINFSNLVSQLYYVEDSAFALHALLKGGYLHKLCARVGTAEAAVVNELMLVLAHIFGRLPAPSETCTLPPLPEDAFAMLSDHETETRGLYKSYVQSYISQHIQGKPDNRLPLSGTVVGNADPEAPAVPCGSTGAPAIRSLFSALSGHDDNTIGSVRELCDTVRDGVFLEPSAMPHIDVASGAKHNSYLLDFFKMGDLHALVRENGISDADVWFLLKDFDMVLATIETSLTNFMKAEAVDEGDDEEQDEEGDEGVEDWQKSGAATVPAAAAAPAADEDSEPDWDNDSDDGGDDGESLVHVLKAFSALKAQFTEKFFQIGA